MADFTSTQGRYLAFIHAYTELHGYPPAESEIATAVCVSPPSVNQMVKMLEKRGLIERQPGQPRSLRVLVPDEQIPPWNNRKQRRTSARSNSRGIWIKATPTAPPSSLYVLSVYLHSGPISEKYTKKEILRVIEIRGDQTLEQLHWAIFKAFDRWDEHLYEFQFGKRPFDPNGRKIGHPSMVVEHKGYGDATKTTLDDLDLKPKRVFGYWFDFGDDWYHNIFVDKIEESIPTVTYPRVIRRISKSPPQYPSL